MAKTKKEKAMESGNTQKNLAGAQLTHPSTRGRTFEGFVTKKFPKRVVVEFERTVFIKKYERFYKKKTRLHARLPDSIDVNIGDYVRVKECRPLSKIIHFIITEKITGAASAGEKKE